MQEPTSFNHTKANSSSTRYPVSSYTQYNHAAPTPSMYDTSGNLGYGVGRLLREGFDRLYSSWHQWWYPPPSKEMLAQHRQVAIYRKRLDAAMGQLDLAVENIRKNPRAKSNLEHFKRVVKESEEYLSPAPTGKLRNYQAHLLSQLRSKIEKLKIGRLKETLLAYLPLVESELLASGKDEVIAISSSSTTTEVASRNQEKRAIEQQTSGYQSLFGLATLNGFNGFVIEGVASYDELGWSVSTAGDLNGDGKADLVVGAFNPYPGSRSSAGATYVIFGQASGWPTKFNLATLNGSNGFVIEEVAAVDHLGRSVSTAGDLNGDGKADLVVGAYGASPGGRSSAGAAYVIFGQASGWPAKFNLTTLNGSNGFVIEGLAAGDVLGWSVSTAGDLNGDGNADLVVGAPEADPGGRSYAGAAYVILGQSSGWPAKFNLTTLNGSNGFVIEGVAAVDHLGRSVSTAGDLNGDGRTDLVVGAFFASPGGRTWAGAAYVILGQASGWPAKFNLTTLNGSNGFVIEGVAAYDEFGASVSTAGDLNGDGKADLVVGAYGADSGGRSYAGAAYVILGQASGWPAKFNLATLNGSNGFVIEGLAAGDWLGSSVSTAGDLNGDGNADLVVGAPEADPGGRTQAGTAYVMFGQASNWPAKFNLATLNGSNGFVIKGVAAYDELGWSVSTAGDLNDDGKADLVVGAYGADSGGGIQAGTAYVILDASASTQPVPSPALTVPSPTLTVPSPPLTVPSPALTVSSPALTVGLGVAGGVLVASALATFGFYRYRKAQQGQLAIKSVGEELKEVGDQNQVELPLDQYQVALQFDQNQAELPLDQYQAALQSDQNQAEQLLLEQYQAALQFNK